jgi:hypothetical protein
VGLTDNLVSYWKLDEASDGSGAVTRVDSKASNNLTDNNTTASAAGVIGNGADFEASNSESLSIADAAQTGLEPGSGDFSISFWFKPESQPPIWSEYQLFSKWDNPSEARSFYLSYNWANGGTDKRLNLSVSADGSGSTNNHSLAQTLVNGTMYHIVFAWDASLHSLEIFVNGSSIGTDASGTLTSIYNGTAPVVIGGPGADGIVDEVGYWSRLLTSAEVTSLYNSGAGLAYPFGAAAYVETYGGPLSGMLRGELRGMMKRVA